MKISDIMTRNLVTVHVDDTVEQLQDLFKQHGFRHVLVVALGTLVGVISDRDVLKNSSPFLGNAFRERPTDRALLNRRAHQIMTRKLIATTSDTPVQEAIGLMLDHHISCLPVVDDRKRPIGIVTSRDLLRALMAVAS
jgi:acetoin utilization protein AcuB